MKIRRSVLNTPCSANADTQLLHQLLARNSLLNGWQFNAKWISGQTQVLTLHFPVLCFDTQLYPGIPMDLQSADIPHYLWNKILPQIFFGFHCDSAPWVQLFFFALQNIEKQVLLNTMRNDFIDNISHRLKTPVSTVKLSWKPAGRQHPRSGKKRKNGYGC